MYGKLTVTLQCVSKRRYSKTTTYFHLSTIARLATRPPSPAFQVPTIQASRAPTALLFSAPYLMTVTLTTFTSHFPRKWCLHVLLPNTVPATAWGRTYQQSGPAFLTVWLVRGFFFLKACLQMLNSNNFNSYSSMLCFFQKKCWIRICIRICWVRS